MLVSLRKFFTEKGQGIVEYAVLLAFVVALAAYLFGQSGVKSEVSKTFSKTVSVLASGNK
jgi:pilus assembly protein Flp/PilA